MATNFPSSLDDSTTIPVESANTKLSTNHVTAHQNIQDAIEAIEAKVGINSSAVTTSHDYKLSTITDSNKAVSNNGGTLTNPIINLGSDAEGDTYYRNSSGALTRLARGTDNYILKMNGNVPNWEAETTISAATESAEGISRLATAAQITAGTATESGYPLVVTPDQLAASTPVFNGSGLTNLTNPAVYKNGTTTYGLTTASGTQTIAHGLGKTPKYIRIKWMKAISASGTAVTPYRGEGVYNGTTISALWEGVYDHGFASKLYNSNISTTKIITYDDSSGSGADAMQEAVPTFDGTNITLTWTKTGSPSGTINILWEAFA